MVSDSKYTSVWIFSPKRCSVFLNTVNILFFIFRSLIVTSLGIDLGVSRYLVYVFLSILNLLIYVSCQIGNSFYFIFIFYFFLGPHLWHMEVPRLGIKLDMQLPASATASWDLSHICDLHHSSWQCQIPDPLSKARDQTCILMDTSWIHFHCAMTGIPQIRNSFTILSLSIFFSFSFAFFLFSFWNLKDITTRSFVMNARVPEILVSLLCFVFLSIPVFGLDWVISL